MSEHLADVLISSKVKDTLVISFDEVAACQIYTDEFGKLSSLIKPNDELLGPEVVNYVFNYIKSHCSKLAESVTVTGKTDAPNSSYFGKLGSQIWILIASNLSAFNTDKVIPQVCYYYNRYYDGYYNKHNTHNVSLKLVAEAFKTLCLCEDDGDDDCKERPIIEKEEIESKETRKKMFEIFANNINIFFNEPENLKCAFDHWCGLQSYSPIFEFDINESDFVIKFKQYFNENAFASCPRSRDEL